MYSPLRIKDWLDNKDYNKLVSDIKERGFDVEDCGDDYAREPNGNLVEFIFDELTEFNEYCDTAGNYKYPGISHMTLGNLVDGFVNEKDELLAELSK